MSGTFGSREDHNNHNAVLILRCNINCSVLQYYGSVNIIILIDAPTYHDDYWGWYVCSFYYYLVLAVCTRRRDPAQPLSVPILNSSILLIETRTRESQAAWSQNYDTAEIYKSVCVFFALCVLDIQPEIYRFSYIQHNQCVRADSSLLLIERCKSC